MPLDLDPVSPALGAEVRGLDLAAEISADSIDEIGRAVAEHGLLIFRGQRLTPEQHLDFGRRFGPLERHVFASARHPEHPEIYVLKNALQAKAAPARPYGGDYWHSDLSYLAEPAMGSMLYALEVPPLGGDTLYANMYLAYDLLSEGMRKMLEGLAAVHEYSRAPGGAEGEAPPRAEHPVVRTHPVTRRRALFISGGFTKRFAAMTAEESAPLLDYLALRCAEPAIGYRHRWRAGDLLFWDNRCTLHRAIRDYGDAPRHMHRVTIGGTRPVLESE